MTEQPEAGAIAATLRKAADVIRERGWCQGGTRDADGRICALGAIDRAHPSNPKWVTLLEAFKGAAGISCVVAWNDEPGRTADEVIAALEAAASSLECDAATDNAQAIIPPASEASPTETPNV